MLRLTQLHFVEQSTSTSTQAQPLLRLALQPPPDVFRISPILDPILQSGPRADERFVREVHPRRFIRATTQSQEALPHQLLYRCLEYTCLIRNGAQLLNSLLTPSIRSPFPKL